MRAFILLRPPFLTDAEGLEWARRSLDLAFALGVACCSMIPTRAGNGAIDELARDGLFAPPSLETLEHALEYGLSLGAGRVLRGPVGHRPCFTRGRGSGRAHWAVGANESSAAHAGDEVSVRP